MQRTVLPYLRRSAAYEQSSGYLGRLYDRHRVHLISRAGSAQHRGLERALSALVKTHAMSANSTAFVIRYMQLQATLPMPSS